MGPAAAYYRYVERILDLEIGRIRHGAGDFEAAIHAALEFEPEVLITDVVMPGMNGLERASHIRSLFPRCKVLLISGRSVAADLVLKTHVLDEGFELLAKPVHPDDLLERL